MSSGPSSQEASEMAMSFMLQDFRDCSVSLCLCGVSPVNNTETQSLLRLLLTVHASIDDALHLERVGHSQERCWA